MPGWGAGAMMGRIMKASSSCCGGGKGGEGGVGRSGFFWQWVLMGLFFCLQFFAWKGIWGGGGNCLPVGGGNGGETDLGGGLLVSNHMAYTNLKQKIIHMLAGI